MMCFFNNYLNLSFKVQKLLNFLLCHESISHSFLKSNYILCVKYCGNYEICLILDSQCDMFMSTSMQSVAFLGTQQFGNLLFFLVCLPVCLLPVFLPLKNVDRPPVDDSVGETVSLFQNPTLPSPVHIWARVLCAHSQVPSKNRYPCIFSENVVPGYVSCPMWVVYSKLIWGIGSI